MIGFIPFVWMSTAEQLGSPAQAAEILQRSGFASDHRFTMDHAYDDKAFARMVQASVEVLGVALPELLRRFAHNFVADLHTYWPVWFEMSPDARSFLKRQPRILESFYRAAGQSGESDGVEAELHVSDMEDGLKVEYCSPNRLCQLYGAVAQEVLAHYHDTVGQVRELQCMHDGHDCCEIEVVWPR